MSEAGHRRFAGLLALAILGAIGAGIWYAHMQGWLAPVRGWVSQLATEGGGERPPVGHAGHGAGGVGAPGMSGMPGEPMGTPSTVPGHATVMIPGELQQRISVRIGHVEKGPLKMSVRAVGIVQPNETQIARIHLKTEGWVEQLFVSFTGQKVKKGDPLLSIYSPQFLVAQQEYLTALAAIRTGGEQAGMRSLLDAARQKLELWDVPPEEIKELERRGTPTKTLMLRTLIGGTVLEKKAFPGQYVKPEDELFVVADLSTVWVQAKVYEYELPHAELGQPATVTIPPLPDRQFTGKVVFVQPTVEEVTRTIQVRVELPNQESIFKPGMFAQIEIAHSMGEGLLIPTSAVLRLGDRDIAYRVEPNDHFVPVEVKLGAIQFGDRYQVLEGLKEGDPIVTSAIFLIDSESRIRTGGGGMAGMHHGGHVGKEVPAQDQSGQGKQSTPTSDHSGHQPPTSPATDHSGDDHSADDPRDKLPAMDHSKMKH